MHVVRTGVSRPCGKACFGVDHAPAHSLQRPRRGPVALPTDPKTPQRTCLYSEGCRRKLPGLECGLAEIVGENGAEMALKIHTRKIHIRVDLHPSWLIFAVIVLIDS